MVRQETHRFFICMAVMISIVALVVLVYCVPLKEKESQIKFMDDSMVKSVIENKSVPVLEDSSTYVVCNVDKKPLTHHEHNSIVKEGIKNHIEKRSTDVVDPKELLLGTRIVKKVVEEKSFFIYDTQLVSSNKGFIVKILMELPPIKVFYADEEYYKYYPLINPYIHVAEMTYEWSFDPITMAMNTQMFLLERKVWTVDWDINRYNTMYIQTMNSPLYLSKMPEPMKLSADELKKFIETIGVLDTIPVRGDLFAKVTSVSPVLAETPKTDLPSTTMVI